MLRRRPFIVATLAALLAPTAVRGQGNAEAHVKARIAFNLARFTQWPAQAFADAAAPQQWCELNRCVRLLLVVTDEGE